MNTNLVKIFTDPRIIELALHAPSGPLRIPQGVDMMSLLDAALAYAKAGWFVLPVRAGKHPGSIVGNGWPTKSSRDPAKIRAWWSKHPSAGIALHVGRSGAVAFDLDKTEDLADLPDELSVLLRRASFQRSRQAPGSARGHYVFATGPDEQFGNGAGEFRDYGDVRGRNGVILAAPTPHAKATTVGGYSWFSAEEVPPLPDGLRACLRAASVDDAEPMTPAALELFLAAHVAEDRPEALDGVLAKLEADLDDGVSRHESAVQALCWAFREAVVGAYPARDAYAAVAEAFEGAFGPADADDGSSRDGREAPGRGELAAAACWAAAQAEVADPQETLRRLHRDNSAPVAAGGLDPAVAKAVDKLRTNDRARAILAEEKAAAHFYVLPRETLGQALDRPREVVPHRIQGLHKVGYNSTISAKYKTGKTTLGVNLLRSLVDGEPFLGRFDVLPAVGRV